MAEIGKGFIMNSLAWFGIIVWGIFVTGFGLTSVAAGSGVQTDVQAQDVVFLISGGLVTCLIGIVGLLGFMGWVPGLHPEKSCA